MQPYSDISKNPRMPLAPRIPLPVPLGIFIEFTNRCNFKCKVCPESLQDYRERVGGFSSMTFDQFKKICDDILSMGGVEVLRYYNVGEPLLHPDATSMIRYGYDVGVAKRTELTTNGSVMFPGVAGSLVTSGLDYLLVSVYGTQPEKHRLNTGSMVKPSTIVENVRHARELRDSLGYKKPFINVRMIYPGDPDEADRFENLYRDVADEVVFTWKHNWNSRRRDFILEDTGPQKEVCPSPFYMLAIHSDGEVSVCCVDWEKKTSVGNIFTESLHDIWNGPRMAELRNKHIQRRRSELEGCRQCDFIHTFPDNIDELR